MSESLKRMATEWNFLVLQYKEAGARQKFEDICLRLFKVKYPHGTVKGIRCSLGDGGIDIYIGRIGLEPIEVFQCKFFPKSIEKSQKDQIRESFKTSIENNKYSLSKWTLCVPIKFSLDEAKWWEQWKQKKIAKYNLSDDFINVFYGSDLIDLLKDNDLYYESFNLEKPKQVSLSEIERILSKTSSYLTDVKNYFGNNSQNHLKRKIVDDVFNWVGNELSKPSENLLLLGGDKGVGKSVVMKDLYNKLIAEKYYVLGVKSDKYYSTSHGELEGQLFYEDGITFQSIISCIQRNNKRIVFIFDQLDALSQTLSTNRQYLLTYLTLIKKILKEPNVRIIISARNFELKHDTDLSEYENRNYKKLNLSLLSLEEVKVVLDRNKTKITSNKLLNLLRTPYHLEIFLRIIELGGVKFDTLTSVRLLLDELWRQLIEKNTSLKLSETLYEIASKFYNEGNTKIIIHKNRIVGKDAELDFLRSNNLIIIDDQQRIQFFHQTFFDYCFARQFVENDSDIEKYLFENNQNLEIRVTIKMVIEYLRDFDNEKYILKVENLLKSKKIRFHIKSLIIQIFASLNEISIGEKRIYNEIVARKISYHELFINSIFSKDWTNHLIELKTPEKLLFKQPTVLNKLRKLIKKSSFFSDTLLAKFDYEKAFESNRSLIWLFFRININTAPFNILEYLESISDFEGKKDFIQRILINHESWDDPRLYRYFRKYFHLTNQAENFDDFWVYQILSKIHLHNPEFAYEILKPGIIERFNDPRSYGIDFTRDQKEFFKRMYKDHPEKSFLFMLDLYIKISEENKNQGQYEKVDSPYYDCVRFFDSSIHENGAHGLIEEFLLNHLNQKNEDIEYVLDFFNTYKDSNAIPVIRVLLLFLRENVKHFKNEIFDLLLIIHAKNGFNVADNIFQLYLRKLIGSSFSSFSDKQKNKMVDILLSIKYPHDLKFTKYKNKSGKDEVYFTGHGKKEYLFLSAIPDFERNNNSILKKRFYELKRRFGDMDFNKACDVGSSRVTVGVPPPYGSRAYEKMDMKNWRKSFLKFDDDYKEDFFLGGKREHSNAFENMVKEKPSVFFDFLIELIEDKEISVDYIVKGITGLIESKYDPVKVRTLYHKAILLNLNRENIQTMIWRSEYLTNHKLIDDVIIDFLIDCALNHSDPERPINKNDPSFDSINCVRGAAIFRIIYCYEQVEFSEKIFSTVEKAMYDPQIAVKVSIIQNLAMLNHLDVDRSFHIFNEMTKEGNVALLKNSFRTSQYFNPKFHFEMYPYFHSIIKNECLHENGNVIVLSWINDKINDKKLYQKFIKSSDKAKLCAIRIAEANIFDSNDEINIKCLEILYSFLHKKDEDFADAYSTFILREIKKEKFELFYDFLVQYSRSSICMLQPRYFLQLIHNCANQFPKKCLYLMQNLSLGNIPDIQSKSYYSKEPVQIIVGIYSKLTEDFQKNKKDIDKTLDLFDSMLKYNHLRIASNEAIDLITR